mmetsp:Transcript_85446/g.151080  ORF Transcript_85446/g.151080 Transcript_85446/m.151080 type:complete len:166 (-) Transcript_85446:823-1320(-)
MPVARRMLAANGAVDLQVDGRTQVVGARLAANHLCARVLLPAAAMAVLELDAHALVAKLLLPQTADALVDKLLFQLGEHLQNCLLLYLPDHLVQDQFSCHPCDGDLGALLSYLENVSETLILNLRWTWSLFADFVWQPLLRKLSLSASSEQCTERRTKHLSYLHL